MLDELRRAIAYIAGNLLSGKGQATRLYDHQADQSFTYSGPVTPGSCSIYDYARQVYLSMTGGPDAYAIRDYGTLEYVSLSVRGTSFRGVDEASQASFEGTVSDQAVTIYDDQDRRHPFDYSLS